MKIVPSEKLREDALGGVPVVLADGQEWVIPKPRVRFTDADNEKGYRAVLSVSALDGYQALLDARDRAAELLEQRRREEDAAEDDGRELAPPPEPGHPIIRAEVAIFKALLLRNYKLEPAEVAEVLQFGYDDETDPDGARIREELLDIAMGNGPKPQGGTSD